MLKLASALLESSGMSRPNQLFTCAAAVGLSFAMTSLALADGAAARPAPDPSRLAAQRATFAKHLEVSELIPSFGQSKDLLLLSQHHNIDQQKHSNVPSELPIHIAKDHTGVLTYNGRNSSISVTVANERRNVTPHDLEHFDLDTAAKIQHRVAELLISTAETGGSANDANAVLRARSTLKGRVDDGMKLAQLLTNALTPDVQQLFAIRASMVAHGRTQKPVILGESDQGTLQITANASNKRYQVMFIPPQSPHLYRIATLADLHHVGISSMAEFDQAVGHAMLEIAPEDLPYPFTGRGLTPRGGRSQYTDRKRGSQRSSHRGAGSAH